MAASLRFGCVLGISAVYGSPILTAGAENAEKALRKIKLQYTVWTPRIV